MPKLAANLSMLFGEVDFLDRFAAAAQAGFRAVEYMFPYDYDEQVLKQKLAEHRLTQVLHNLPAGDWAAGERGFACHPDRVEEFEAGVDRAIGYAQALGCTQLNCLAGITPSQVHQDAARDTFIRNLQFAAPRLANAGIKLLIEAVNTRDVPGFFLCGTSQALDIMAAVGSDNVFLQYDVYHMRMMGEDVAGTIERWLNAIGHIQVADVPGRHEPGTGSIDYGTLFNLLDRSGYAGWIGCEYKPAGRTEDGLGWTRRYL